MHKTMKQKIALSLIILFAVFTACSDDDNEVIKDPIISGIEESYTLLAGEKLEIKPTIENSQGSTFLWTLNGQKVAETQIYLFSESEPGEYNLVLEVIKEGIAVKTFTTNIVVGEINFTIEGETNTIISLLIPDLNDRIDDFEWEIIEAPSALYRFSKTPAGSTIPMFITAEAGEYMLQLTSEGIEGKVTIIVTENEQELSPYISDVYEYMPAPGQQINKMPKYVDGDTYEDMLVKVADALVGDGRGMISLGGWGGYVTFGFDHTIVNVANKQDFRVEGNAFTNSSEPGIIMVSYDANENGEPDDEWFEIEGSGNLTAENEDWYQSAVDAGNDVATYRDYEMTYHKPEVDTPTAIEEYIYWTNNKGEKGYKKKITFHKQSYYPEWISEDNITFSGIRLAENAVDQSGQGSYYVLKSYKYGYVDNHSNRDDRSTVDIDWAVDKDGNKVNLPGIDFVKIYTGVDQENGNLGELSTEISRAFNLHMNDEDIDSIE